MFCWRTCWKGYDRADAPWYNLEVELFIAQWIVQMEEDMHGLRVVKYHILPWDVVGKEMCYCQIVLKLQEGKDVDQPYT